MAGLLDLLQGEMGKQIIKGVSSQSNTSEDKTKNVLLMALPVLMGAMKRNTATSQGAEGLMGALTKKHDGSILDNLGGLFGGGVDKSVTDDGVGILGHVLGGSEKNVTSALSAKSGVDAKSVAKILAIAAPILLGYLGKQQRQKKVNSSSGLGDLLGGLMGGSSSNQPKQQSMIESFLDGDGDGSILDDVAGMVFNSGSSKKKGGMGGLLGGLFGGK